MWTLICNRLLVMVAVLAACLCRPGQAEATSRYALLIGANQGLPGEAALQFAIADTERMSQVLQTQGGFVPENTTILRQPTADRVRAVLGAINARIRNEGRGRESVLLVFYSGHADERAVHLGDSLLPWSELRDLTTGSAANTRLLIVDACRSGAATRVKGVVVDTPFALAGSMAEVPDGFAILSSAAAGEFAQESDTIRSSFFTFHLVAALQGLGDQNADGAVTLAEAFDYTSDRTVASTAATLAGIQHPTYRYDLKGRSNFVITRPGADSSRAVKLTMIEPGVHLWREGSEQGRLVLEANVAKQAQVAWLSPGRYHLQRRGRDRFYQGEVTLIQGRPVETKALRLKAVSYDQLVRKGGRTTSNALGVRAGLARPWVEGYEQGVSIGLHVAHTRPEVTFDAGIETAQSHLRLPAIAGDIRGYSGFLGALKMFDFSFAALGAGIRLGVSHLSQTFDTLRNAPARSRWLPSATMLTTLTTNLPLGAFIGVEVGLTVTALESIDQGGRVTTDARVMPWGSLEVGKRF